jgi:hypothetical protein
MVHGVIGQALFRVPVSSPAVQLWNPFWVELPQAVRR